MKIVNRVLAIVVSIVMVLTVMPAVSREYNVNAAEEFVIVSRSEERRVGKEC